MASGPGNDWLKPSTILAAVMALATFGSMWMSFDRRVTENQNNIAALNERLSEHKAEEAARLARIEDKLDHLIERSEGK